MWHESQELLEQFVGTELQDTTDSLGDEQRRELWQLFVAIHDTWGSDAARPEEMDSRWREFIHEKCVHSPSYLPVYR